MASAWPCWWIGSPAGSRCAATPAGGDRAVMPHIRQPAQVFSPSPPRSGGEGRVRGYLRVGMRAIAHAARPPSPYPLPPRSRGERGNIQIRASERRQAGFTLVEMLVAFTVAVLLLSAVYRVFSAGLRAEGSAEAYAK